MAIGTGVGKSLCFMLPAASCPGGLTIVVVPLMSLQGNLMDRCQKLNISYAEWRSDRVQGEMSIVFITPESAITKHFQDFIESQQAIAKIDRFIMDKSHTITEGTLSFRPKLRELGSLALIGIQMVYLTATLPPADKSDFFNLVNTRRDDVVIIQAKITRSNLAYSIRSFTATTVKEATAAVVENTKAIIDQKLEEYR
jgi:superfamily II DNA helicase RecQ